MTPATSVRDRRRAETVAEIKAAALAQLAASGTGGLSLRGVARTVGMTVQSLYHYFDSREALLTVLVTDSHHALADAVQESVGSSRGQPPCARRVAAGAAFRTWALAHTPAFLLLYGTPVPGFDPRPAAEHDSAAARLAAPFVEVVFAGWTAAELAALPLAPGGESLAALDSPVIPLPPGALTFLFELRARMQGLVMLELLGHLHPVDAASEVFFTAAMARMSGDIDALRSTLTP